MLKRTERFWTAEQGYSTNSKILSELIEPNRPQRDILLEWL